MKMVWSPTDTRKRPSGTKQLPNISPYIWKPGIEQKQCNKLVEKGWINSWGLEKLIHYLRKKLDFY